MSFNPSLFIAIFALLPIATYAQTISEQLDALLDSVYTANEDALGILIHVRSPDFPFTWSRAVGFSDQNKDNYLGIRQPVLMASNTKPYVATAVLRLVEQKRLQLDAPIQDLLTRRTRRWLQKDQYDLSQITVRHLLSHTSGIHDYVDEAYFDLVIQRPRYRWSKKEQIKRAMKIGAPLSEPGQAFHYGDINYLLLTEIIEQQTGEAFYTAMRTLLNYEKLGLKHTWFKTLEPTPEDLPPFAHQYAKDYQWDSYHLDPSWDLYGGGGIATTVEEAALFYQYLFTGKIIEDEALLKELHTYVLPPETSKYCLGFYHFDFGFHLYYHGGWWGTGVNYSPETNTSIAVFTLVKEKRNDVNPVLGKRIHEIINAKQHD